MKLTRLAASLLAVALFMGPVSAQEQPADGSAAVVKTKAILPPSVMAMLLDTRPLEQMSDKELGQRLNLARKFQGLAGLNDDVRIALETAAASAEEELATRQTVVADDAEQPAETLLPIGTQVPDDVLAYVQTPASPNELSDAELKARVDTGREMLAREGWPSDILNALKDQVSSYRKEQMVRQAAGKPANPELVDQTGELSDAAFTSPADIKALKIINDRRAAKTMELGELRARVKESRRLMGAPKLSGPVKDQLYKKLSGDRIFLRMRMAGVNGGAQGKGLELPEAQATPEASGQVLKDMRPADGLGDDDLRSRIKAFSAAAGDKNASALDRANLDQRLKADRRILRQRMLEERSMRQVKLKKPGKHIILNQEPAPFDDITAAEAAEDELEDLLVAAPRQKAKRRYTIDEFERDPDLRAAVPRIEIDTIRFGFNESFIREEEIDSLDRVAEIMERILASNPYEVFMIEGHTDASGSDSYNLGLSRQRARAVVEALSTFYVIPPDNLRAVGYGERYLKIPVPYAEAENRRVSVSRVTDFLALQ